MVYFLFYPFVFVLLRFVIVFFGRLKASGEHNVPRTGPVIYCPNHLSDVDPPTVFVSAPRRAWYVGKEELFVHWFWGWFFREYRGIPIKRDSADRHALRVVESKLKNGDPVVIFPEGRCAQDGKLQTIQPGAALMALRTRAVVIPVGIEHSNLLMPYGEFTPRFSRIPVHIHYGEPIHMEEFAHLKHSEAIAALTSRIGQDLARLTHQDPSPEPQQHERRKRPNSPSREPSTSDHTNIAETEKELG